MRYLSPLNRQVASAITLSMIAVSPLLGFADAMDGNTYPANDDSLFQESPQPAVSTSSSGSPAVLDTTPVGFNGSTNSGAMGSSAGLNGTVEVDVTATDQAHLEKAINVFQTYQKYMNRYDTKLYTLYHSGAAINYQTPGNKPVEVPKHLMRKYMEAMLKVAEDRQLQWDYQMVVYHDEGQNKVRVNFYTVNKNEEIDADNFGSSVERTEMIITQGKKGNWGIASELHEMKDPQFVASIVSRYREEERLKEEARLQAQRMREEEARQREILNAEQARIESLDKAMQENEAKQSEQQASAQPAASAPASAKPATTKPASTSTSTAPKPATTAPKGGLPAGIQGGATPPKTAPKAPPKSARPGLPPGAAGGRPPGLPPGIGG